MSGVRRGGLRQSVVRLSMRVWDLPVRLFHWLAVALVVAGTASNYAGNTRVHVLSGYALLTLLLFRLGWGFVGSDTARFSQFLRSPAAALRHLARFRVPEPDDEVGYSASGGWMTLALLALFALLVGTGLFSSNDSGFHGPLAHLTGQTASGQANALHALSFDLLLAVTALHVVAVAAYALVKKHNLLRPMVTGRKRLPGTTRQPRMASPVLAVGLVALAGCIVWVLATRI